MHHTLAIHLRTLNYTTYIFLQCIAFDRECILCFLYCNIVFHRTIVHIAISQYIVIPFTTAECRDDDTTRVVQYQNHIEQNISLHCKTRFHIRAEFRVDTNSGRGEMDWTLHTLDVDLPIKLKDEDDDDTEAFLLILMKMSLRVFQVMSCSPPRVGDLIARVPQGPLAREP